MQAVDAAEGPEVENNDFAAQILQGEVLIAGVEPGSAFEFAGAHAYGAGGVLAHGFLSCWVRRVWARWFAVPIMPAWGGWFAGS